MQCKKEHKDAATVQLKKQCYNCSCKYDRLSLQCTPSVFITMNKIKKRAITDNKREIIARIRNASINGLVIAIKGGGGGGM